MRSLVFLVVGLLLVDGASAAQRDSKAPPPIVRTNVAPPTSGYGAWLIQDGADYAGTYTENRSGSVFGLLCGQTCIGYVNVQIACENGRDYPAMINSNWGSFSVVLKCHIFDDRYLLSLEAGDSYLNMLSGGGEVGFAVPLKDGRFNVSRFSLSGASSAAERTIERAIQMRKMEQSELRDFAI